MDANEIKSKYAELSSALKQALATMQMNDRVFTIRDEIKDLQRMCPHSNGAYNFEDTEECPYCGKKFGK